MRDGTRLFAVSVASQAFVEEEVIVVDEVSALFPSIPDQAVNIRVSF